MARTVMTMVENIHSQMQEVLNDNVNKLDIQNALYQLEEVRDILNDMEEE
jgi:succinate dehydrogenase/fumarate reductase flavoprotein subunit